MDMPRTADREANDLSPRVREHQTMSCGKKEQLQLLTWLLLIVGLAMVIPSYLVLGVVEYVFFGDKSDTSHQTRADAEDMPLRKSSANE
jgi:DNA-binding helix-hairpin-helix protein with protein kinase domain